MTDPSYWTVDPSEQLKEAEQRLLKARALLASAQKIHEGDPCRTNEIALKAAERLAKEELARAEEWLP